MDDILVLAPTCWKLRAAVKMVNCVLVSLDLKKHPAKTFIGRIEKGFDWLGYHLRPDGLRLAAQTLRNFAARMTRLYEQKSGCADGGVRLGSYVRRWMRWATGGLGDDGNRVGGLVMATCALGSLCPCFVPVALPATPVRLATDSHTVGRVSPRWRM